MLPRRIRSLLFAPAVRPDLLRKMPNTGADAMVIDLETVTNVRNEHRSDRAKRIVVVPADYSAFLTQIATVCWIQWKSIRRFESFGDWIVIETSGSQWMKSAAMRRVASRETRNPPKHDTRHRYAAVMIPSISA